MSEIDFSKITSVLDGLKKLFSINASPAPIIPPPLILKGGASKHGLSSQQIASKIIARQSEAGIPVGNLTDGSVNPNEIMERIRVEEIINALLVDAKITVVIPAGTQLTAQGTAGPVPCAVVGQTITLTVGYGQIQ